MLVRNKSIHFNSAIESFSLNQDTIISNSSTIAISDSISIPKVEQPESIQLNVRRELDLNQIDSILKRSEERERQIEIQEQAIIQRPIYRRVVDTTEVLYKQFGIAGFPIKDNLDKDPFNQNVLYNFSSLKPTERQVNENVFIEAQRTDIEQNSKTSVSIQKEDIRPEYIKNRIQFDWITILLAASFLVLGWVRLFNKKYLISLAKAAISYQESNTLYREKNSLMERASFLINLFFMSNVSIFTVQLLHFFDLKIYDFKDYVVYFIVFTAVLILYIFRALSSAFIAYVFLKQKVFSEYFHNVNIYTKNTGLVLFPVIIALQFLTYEYLGIFIYAGILLAAVLYLFQLIRAFQIIIRKNVSIFYMILYLCAFEFVPFLIVYKLVLSVG